MLTFRKGRGGKHVRYGHEGRFYFDQQKGSGSLSYKPGTVTLEVLSLRPRSNSGVAVPDLAAAGPSLFSELDSITVDDSLAVPVTESAASRSEFRKTNCTVPGGPSGRSRPGPGRRRGRRSTVGRRRPGLSDNKSKLD
eukprot:758854-Hanusia_phi.AAC.2